MTRTQTMAEVETVGHSLENIIDFEAYCELISCTSTTLERVIDFE